MSVAWVGPYQFVNVITMYNVARKKNEIQQGIVVCYLFNFSLPALHIAIFE